MPAYLLHDPIFVPEILVNALMHGEDRILLSTIDGEEQTVSDVRDITSRFVQALEHLGIGRHSKVAILSANRLEVLHIGNALLLVCATKMALHPLDGLEGHVNAIANSGIDCLLYDARSYAGRAADIAERLPNLRIMSFGCAGAESDIGDLVNSFSPRTLVAPPVKAHEVSHIGSSGGTTGKPKRLAMTQGIHVTMLTIMMAEWEWPSPPRSLACAPLSHVGQTMFLPTLLRGGSMLVLPQFDALEVMKAVQEHRINCLMLVPTMIYAILDHPRFGEFDLSSIETIFYGASSISPDRLREAIERIGPVFFQFYGQAEAPATLIVMRKSEHLASLIHDARFRARSGHLLRLAVLRGRPASLAFVSPHSD